MLVQVMIFKKLEVKQMKKYAINRRIHRDPTTYFKSHPILEVLKYIAVIIGSYAISKLEEFVNKHDDTTKE
jgi:hypothetical protein